MGNYNATYTSDDMDNAVIDGLVTVVASLVGFGSLIGLVILARWLMNKRKVV